MKNFFIVCSMALLFVGLMLFSLPGYGSQNTTKVGVIFSVPDPTHGGGWDRVHIRGLEAISKFGWEISIAENVPYPKATEIAGAYADKGYDIVIYTDGGMVESWKEAAQKYPNTWFIEMSKVDKLPDSGKAAVWQPDKFGYGCIVGAVAAKASKTGVIGLVGGIPIPPIVAEFSGIIQAVKTIRPDAKVLISWAGDFVDLGKHSQATSLLTQKGADIIFTVSGTGYKGVFEATRKAGALTIGYGDDFYNEAPDINLTAVLYDGRKMYTQLAEAYENGTLESKMYPVGFDFFEVTDFHGKISPELEKDIRDTVAKIKSGELKIPEKIYDQLESEY